MYVIDILVIIKLEYFVLRNSIINRIAMFIFTPIIYI